MNKFLQIWNMESKCLPLGVHRNLQGHKLQKEDQIYNLFFVYERIGCSLPSCPGTKNPWPVSKFKPPTPTPTPYALCLKIKMALSEIQFVMYESFKGFDIFLFFIFFLTFHFLWRRTLFVGFDWNVQRYVKSYVHNATRFAKGYCYTSAMEIEAMYWAHYEKTAMSVRIPN